MQVFWVDLSKNISVITYKITLLNKFEVFYHKVFWMNYMLTFHMH